MFQFLVSLKITALSALYGFRLVYRKGRRDVSKRYRQLTSPEAVALYRWLWAAFLLLCEVCIFAGKVARHKLDAFVEGSLRPVPADVPTVDVVAVVVRPVRSRAAGFRKVVA